MKLGFLLRTKWLVHEAANCLEGANVEEKYVFLLKRAKNLHQGKEIHARAEKDGVNTVPFVAAALIQMYGKHGSIHEAKLAFDKVVKKNVFSWNIMITAYGQNGHIHEAKQTFDDMPPALRNVVSWNAIIGAYSHSRDIGANEDAFRIFLLMILEGEKPSRSTFLALLDMCCNMKEAKMVHSHALETGFMAQVAVATALVKVYGKLGELEYAKQVFEGMDVKNVVSWTVMLGAFVQGGHLQKARKHFEEMPERNVVSWNLMLGAYAQSGNNRDALVFFREMDIQGMQVDRITFAYILVACAQLEELKVGQVVHESIRSLPSSSWDKEVWNSLLDMYGKCGKMEAASQVFYQEMERCSSSVPWTIMIGNYARNGLEKYAKDMLMRMSLEGIYPSEVLFISLLAVCTHGGLLKASREYLVSMDADYGLAPGLEHYMCVVDLLGRMGKLEEARQVVENMPYEPDIKVWKALLSSCKSHGNAEAAFEAAGLALGIDKQAHTPYVMLSNILRP